MNSLFHVPEPILFLTPMVVLQKLLLGRKQQEQPQVSFSMWLSGHRRNQPTTLTVTQLHTQRNRLKCPHSLPRLLLPLPVLMDDWYLLTTYFWLAGARGNIWTQDSYQKHNHFYMLQGEVTSLLISAFSISFFDDSLQIPCQANTHHLTNSLGLPSLLSGFA